MCDSVCMHISTGFLCTVGTWSEEHSRSKYMYFNHFDFVILICLVSDMRVPVSQDAEGPRPTGAVSRPILLIFSH